MTRRRTNRGILLDVEILVTALLEKQEKLMAQIDDLKTSVQALQDDLSTSLANIAAILAGLQGQQAPDLQPVIDQVNAVKASLDAFDAGLPPAP